MEGYAMKRRTFIGALAASAAWMAGGMTGTAGERAGATNVLPRRPLGRTGLTLPVIGFSGLVGRDNTPEAVDRVVGESLDMGIDFFDTAASYGDSEVMLAPVLRHRRKDIILATKTRLRTREGAEAEFRKSCEILGTDYFDMYLFHGIQHLDRDVDPAFAAGGAMEFFIEKKKSGQIRFLGFSAHSTEAALAAMDRYDYDFFYFPVSYVSYFAGNFGPTVLAKAREKGVPFLSLKAMARQRWPESVPREERCAKCWYQPIEDPEEGSLALRWALSQHVVSVLPPGDEDLYRKTLALSDNLAPITPEETERLKAMAANMNPLFPR